MEAISRLISLLLRTGNSIQQVIEQLEGIGSNVQVPTKEGSISSLADGISVALKKYIELEKQSDVVKKISFYWTRADQIKYM